MVEPATAGGRVEAYDLARTFAIVFVFLGHIIITQTTSFPLKVAFGTLSPGLTMSLLGFISAALLSTRTNEAGVFLVRRFTRIYIPLFTCLAAVLIIQYAVGTAKAHTTDLVLHFLGLSGFFELFPHLNHASVGQGLWFVTTILSMYLLLPALQRVFAHRRGLIHLVIVVGLSLAAYRWMNAGGAWNVVIAFCIGTYLGVNGRLEAFYRRPITLHLVFACCLLAVCALSSAKVIPFWIRGLLLPFYPLAFVPLFFAAARLLPRWVNRGASGFAAVSYEFYILHFYFIGRGFNELVGGSTRMALEIPISFALVLAVATGLYLVDSRLRRPLDAYLLETRRAREEISAR
jgi:peptidoglycan/LPS O-acetylase OafA/YrhL